MPCGVARRSSRAGRFKSRVVRIGIIGVLLPAMSKSTLRCIWTGVVTVNDIVTRGDIWPCRRRLCFNRIIFICNGCYRFAAGWGGGIFEGIKLSLEFVILRIDIILIRNGALSYDILKIPVFLLLGLCLRSKCCAFNRFLVGGCGGNLNVICLLGCSDNGKSLAVIHFNSCGCVGGDNARLLELVGCRLVAVIDTGYNTVICNRDIKSSFVICYGIALVVNSSKLNVCERVAVGSEVIFAPELRDNLCRCLAACNTLCADCVGDFVAACVVCLDTQSAFGILNAELCVKLIVGCVYLV